MLKGLLIASSGAGLLEEELDRNRFPWAEVPKKDGEAFRDAAAFQRRPCASRSGRTSFCAWWRRIGRRRRPAPWGLSASAM